MFNKVKKGEIYRAIKDTPMLGMIVLKAPGSGGFYCTLPQNTKLVILSNPVLFANATYAVPLNYKEMEEILVPQKDRESLKYKEYSLVFKFKDLKNFVKEGIQKD